MVDLKAAVKRFSTATAATAATAATINDINELSVAESKTTSATAATGQAHGSSGSRLVMPTCYPETAYNINAVAAVAAKNNDVLQISDIARRRPWEIDPAGERQEEDAKFFRDLHRRACERAGLPAPVSPLADAMTVLLENWRHEDEAAWRRWAAKAPWDSEYLAT